MQQLKQILKKAGVLAVVMSVLLSVTGCSGEKGKKETESQPAVNQAQTEGTKDSTADEENVSKKDDEIVLGGYRNIAPGKDDGYYCSVILYVWEPLITQDDNGAPISKLAQSWEMSDDAKEWTFHLRQGVKFHDGEDFNSDAVIANFDRMKLGAKQSNFYSLNIDSFYPNLDQVAKVDDHTVKLTFKVPSPTQLYNMVNFGSAMFSPKGFDADGNFSGIVSGTGPFKIKENVADEYVLLERNENYWGEPAKAAAIRVRTMPEVDTRYSAMKSGEIMGVMDLRAITPALAVELTKDPQFGTETAKSTLISFLAANGTRYPFNDVRLRQAVSLAIDRQTIVDKIYLGFGEPTTNILNYCSPFYKEIPVEYNMDQAKKPAGEALGDKRVTIQYLISDSAEQKAEAELISSILSQIGIDTEIRTYDWATIKDMMGKGDYDLARGDQGLSNSEASSLLKRFMASDGDQNLHYSLGYNNPMVDRMLEEAMGSLDMTVRSDLYDKLQDISARDLPIIPLFNNQTLMVYNKKLTGYHALIYGVDLPNVGWAD